MKNAPQKRPEAQGYVGRAEYARSRKLDYKAVQKAIDSGRLSKSVKRGPSGRVLGLFPELADAEWEANTDQVRAPLPVSTAFQDARVRRESALAETAEMDLRRKRGELVDAAE